MHFGIHGLALLGFIIGAARVLVMAPMMAPMNAGPLGRWCLYVQLPPFYPMQPYCYRFISSGTLAIILPLEQ